MLCLILVTVSPVNDAPVLDSISGALSNGDSVALVGFGTFNVRERAARMGRNPATGETIQIAASKGVGFKAGKSLKDSL